MSFDNKFTRQGFENACLPRYRKKLGECLLISSLPGKASRTLVDIARLAEQINSLLKAKPGKLDIERLEPGIIFITTHCFTLQSSDYDISFDYCIVSAS